MVTLNAAKTQNIPTAAVLELGGIKLDCYTDCETKESFFSAAQLATQLGDYSKEGCTEYLKSKRSKTLAGYGVETTVDAPKNTIKALDSLGREIKIKPVSVEQAALYIVDLVRKNPKNKIAWAVASLLAVDSLVSRVAEIVGKPKTNPDERASADKQIFRTIAPIHNRKDCSLTKLQPQQELVTSTELALNLGLPITRNNFQKFSYYMLQNGESDKLVGRRMYDFNNRNIELALRYFHQWKPSPLFSDDVVNNFEDLM